MTFLKDRQKPIFINSMQHMEVNNMKNQLTLTNKELSKELAYLSAMYNLRREDQDVDETDIIYELRSLLKKITNDYYIGS